jgi:hypothetical protein
LVSENMADADPDSMFAVRVVYIHGALPHPWCPPTSMVPTHIHGALSHPFHLESLRLLKGGANGAANYAWEVARSWASSAPCSGLQADGFPSENKLPLHHLDRRL